MYYRFGRLPLAAGVLAALTACGGGGSGGSSAPPVAGAPTPSPSPSPTPTPVAYQSPTDYSTSFSVASSLGYAAEYFVSDNRSLSSTVGVYLLPEDQATTLSFSPNPEQLQFQYAGAQASWTGADRAAGGSQRYYQRAPNDLVLGFEGRTTPVTAYVTKAAWVNTLGSDTLNGVAGKRYRVSFGIVGAPTVPSELPTDEVDFRGSTILFGGEKSGRFTNQVDSTAHVDLRYNGDISGSFNVYDSDAATPAASNTSLLISGKIDRATGILKGSLASVDNSFIGTLRGRLFGPQGRELAATFYARRSTDRAEIAGDFVGRR